MPKYGTFKDALLNAFVLGQIPESAPVWMAAGIGPEYSFSIAHATIADLGDNVVLEPAVIENVEWLMGMVDGDDVTWEHPDSVGLTAIGVVIILQWAEGNQLVTYTEASEAGTLPFTFIDANVTIRWNEAGIFQL